jgi:hypothetical protein
MSLVRPPGRRESGPNQGTTNSGGGISVPIRSRGSGTYILVISTGSSDSSGGVAVGRAEIGAVKNGSVAKRMQFGAAGSTGRCVILLFFTSHDCLIPYEISIQSIIIKGVKLICLHRPYPNTIVWHLDSNGPDSFMVDLYTANPNSTVYVSLWCAPPGTALPRGAGWKPSDWYNH